MEKSTQNQLERVRRKKSGELGNGAVSHESAVSPFPSGIRVQAQLETTAPGDEYEQEADSMADLVLRKIETGSTGEVPLSPSVKARPSVSAYGGSSVPLPSRMESRLRSSLGAGQRLPGQVRSQMEGAFGQSFSQVQIHTDAAAAEMSRSIGARAFTYGNDVFFNQGQYNPYSSAGQRLLAHELTHTLQQGGKVARSMSKKEKEDRKKKATVNAAMFRDAPLLIPLIKYLCPMADQELCVCYIDALIRGEEVSTPYTDIDLWVTTWQGAWEQNLEAFGRSKDKRLIRERYIHPDYFERIAEDHLELIREKMNKGRPTTNSLVDAQNRARSAMYQNDRDTNLDPVVRAVENQYYQHLIKANDPSTFNPYKRPDTLADPWVYTAAFGVMLAAPLLGAAGLYAAGAASSFWASSVAAGRFVKLISFLESPPGRLLVNTLKDGSKKAYSMWKDHSEGKDLTGQFIELGFEILIDTLGDTVLKGVDSKVLKTVFSTVCNDVISKLVKLSQGNDLDADDVVTSVNGAVSIALSGMEMPSAVEKAITVVVSILLDALFGVQVDKRSIANYKNPMEVWQGSAIAELTVYTPGIDVGVLAGYVGYLQTLAVNQNASVNLT